MSREKHTVHIKRIIDVGNVSNSLNRITKGELNWKNETNVHVYVLSDLELVGSNSNTEHNTCFVS